MRRRLARDQRGASVVEYAMLIAMVVIIVGGVVGLKDAVKHEFARQCGQVSATGKCG